MRGLNLDFLLLFSLLYIHLTEEVMKEAIQYRQLLTMCVVKKICKGKIIILSIISCVLWNFVLVLC